jgi:hypothetical protein
VGSDTESDAETRKTIHISVAYHPQFGCRASDTSGGHSSDGDTKALVIPVTAYEQSHSRVLRRSFSPSEFHPSS